MRNAGADSGDILVELGGGKLPDAKWGYINVNWPFVRLRLSATRVRFEPAFLRNWIVFRLPTWEATWDQLRVVTARGSKVHFIPKAGPTWTYFTLGATDRVMAHVPPELRQVEGGQNSIQFD